MNQLDQSQETGEAPEAAHGRSDLQTELAEVLRQRAAISAVLRAIANSPHELQPIFDAILDSATRLCRAEAGTFRLVEEAGHRLVAHKLSPAVLEGYSPPMLREHGSFLGRLIAGKSPVHIPDLAAHEVYRAGEASAVALVKGGLRTHLLVPMLINDELVGLLTIGRQRVEHFTEKEIELVTDFAAQATIALEIVRRERQRRKMQMELAHANRVATMGQLTASITHEVKQPIASSINNARAALNWLNRQTPDLEEVRQALACVIDDGKRASEVIDRIRDLVKKTPPRTDHLEINGAIREVIELTRGEAVKNGISVQLQTAEGLPLGVGDRVQLQQVIVNLIINAVQAMSEISAGPRQLLISTEKAESDGVLVAVRDTGPGLAPGALEHVFEPFHTTKPNGLGLGLSICRSIIEAHGGRLWATANQPRGAIFQFTLPAHW